MSTTTVEGWEVVGLCAKVNGVFLIEAEIERYRDCTDTLVVHSCPGDPHDVPLPVIIALLRNAGYTVTKEER